MFTPLLMIQPYINLLPSTASLPPMLVLNPILIILKLLTEWGTCNFLKFNTSKTQLLTISLSDTLSNYPIPFVNSEILSINFINILRLQISSSLSWKNHIILTAKSAYSSTQFFSSYTLALFVPAWNIALRSGVLSLLLFFLTRWNQRLSAWLTISPPLDLDSWPSIASLQGCFAIHFYHNYFGHCPDELAACIPPRMAQPRSTCQYHLHTIIVWNFLMQELIGSVMVSSPLLPT